MAISAARATKFAIEADKAWQEKLDACGVDRWSADAKGKPGTVLRCLYEAKLYADQVMSEAFAKERAQND